MIEGCNDQILLRSHKDPSLVEFVLRSEANSPPLTERYVLRYQPVSWCWHSEVKLPSDRLAILLISLRQFFSE